MAGVSWCRACWAPRHTSQTAQEEKSQSSVLDVRYQSERLVKAEHLSVVGCGVLSCGGEDDHCQESGELLSAAELTLQAWKSKTMDVSREICSLSSFESKYLKVLSHF